MNKRKAITRRGFLKRTAALAGGAAVFPAIIPGSALGVEGRPSPSNRVVMGSIGVGPQGSGVMGNFLTRQKRRWWRFAT